MKKLRVLVCAFTCCAPGTPGFTGGESLLGWNMMRQISRFHEVWALTQAQDRASLESSLAEESPSDIHLVYVDLSRWLRPLLRVQGGHQLYYLLWQVNAYFAARRLHKQSPFDLFHHITYANDWMACFIGALLPAPYIRGPGGGAHRTPRGLEQEYSIGGRIWERLRAICQWLFRQEPFFVRGQGRARSILVCNRESMAAVPNKWRHKVHLFPVNGISLRDLELVGPALVEDHEFRVLTAGTLIRVKGFTLAIKAFKEFFTRHPESRFTIIGSGPEERRLKRLVRRARLNDCVQFVASMPRNALLSEMRRCDAFLFPSLRDGGGAVVIEALAAGKPVVCLDTGGPGMHVTEEVGIKVRPSYPSQTVHDMADALERLYSDAGLRLSMGRAARQRAQQVYHWDRLGEKLMEIYEAALEPTQQASLK